MRRGQEPRPVVNTDDMFSKQELLDASGLSAKTFDTIRKASRVRGPSHGGLNWAFSLADVHAMIQRAGSGNFTERGGPAVEGWTRMLQERGFPTRADDSPGHGRRR